MKINRVFSRAFFFAMAVMMCARTASADIYEVSSIPDLQAAIDSAVAGDTIVMHDGVYATTGYITVSRQGTAADPIRIVAQTIGGVEITGTHGFNVVSPATYIEIRGFLFTHASGRNQIRSGATHIRFAQNFFECIGSGAYLTVAGYFAEIDLAFNTLVNSTRNYFMTGRTNGLGATNTVFANNILQGGGAAASLNGPYTGGVWSGNIIWETAGAGVMPPGTFDEVNPLLEPKANGVFRPQPGSPAIDSAVGDYSWVTVDMDGQPRAEPKDRGADEVSSDPVSASLLTPGVLLRLIHRQP